MKKIALVLLCIYNFSYAVEYDEIEAEMLAISCTSCHGIDEETQSVAPVIAGMPKDNLYEILLNYKNGKKTGTMMKEHVKNYTDAQLEQIAYFFSNIEKD